MPMQDEILAQSLRIIRGHLHPEVGDRSLLDVFNRLLAKHVTQTLTMTNDHLDIQEHQITSRQEQWTTEKLKGLVTRRDPSEQDSRCPVVIAIYDGIPRLLDGNHRINFWVAHSIQRTHQVNIHEVSGVGSLIKLPKLDF
jgi:hypothetical protein